jgi:hypothetical protein
VRDGARGRGLDVGRAQLSSSSPTDLVQRTRQLGGELIGLADLLVEQGGGRVAPQLAHPARECSRRVAQLRSRVGGRGDDRPARERGFVAGLDRVGDQHVDGGAAAGVERVDDIAARLDPTDTQAGRTDALTIFGLLIGTLQLARALTDRDLSDQLLAQGAETAVKLLNDRARALSPTELLVRDETPAGARRQAGG